MASTRVGEEGRRQAGSGRQQAGSGGHTQAAITSLRVWSTISQQTPPSSWFSTVVALRLRHETPSQRKARGALKRGLSALKKRLRLNSGGKEGGVREVGQQKESHGRWGGFGAGAQSELGLGATKSAGGGAIN